MGNPVSHSKSPTIHSAFGKQTGVPVYYQAICVREGDLARAVTAFRDAGGLGVNITVPYKEEAFALADEATDRARQAGAANTLRFDDGGRILADNTDGYGLIRDIKRNHGQVIAGRSLLILGAGGAVRGILGPLLAERPSNVCIINRTVDRARRLVEAFPTATRVAVTGYEKLPEQCFDIVINGTSAGLGGEAPDLPARVLCPGGWCYDLMYAHGLTPFLLWARRCNAGYFTDGLGMLVEQAAESFRIWLGVTPETGPVIAALRQ